MEEKIEVAFRRSDVLNLAERIQKQLGSSPGIRVSPDSRQASFSGYLNLSHTNVESDVNAYCQFHVFCDWETQLPALFCHEPWVKKDWDWHVGKDGNVCYELPLRWQDHIRKVRQEAGFVLAIGYAATWCLNSTRWLLYRHHFAYENSISVWPKNWPAWRHNEDGISDYRRSPFRRSLLRRA
jgi:hypothetical protein